MYRQLLFSLYAPQCFSLSVGKGTLIIEKLWLKVPYGALVLGWGFISSSRRGLRNTLFPNKNTAILDQRGGAIGRFSASDLGTGTGIPFHIQ